LDDDVGIAVKIFRPKFRKQTRIKIVNIAGLRADDDRDGFSLVEIRLSKDSRIPAADKQTDEN